jgi:16S rRNA (adenine1518-N6/adenine1519-N6)-dimethyltransferase
VSSTSLPAPPHPRNQLAGTAIQPKKNFGQNFLTDDHHLAAIARHALSVARPAAGVAPTAIEFGPGLGALTHFLLAGDAQVVAIERDRDLVPLLEKRFASHPHRDQLTIIEGNALAHPLDDQPDGYAMVGNLPYHHAADLCMRCLDALPRVGGGCFLIQKEVAERIAADPGNKDYGTLSVMLQSRLDVELAHIVPKGAFWPAPEVDGGVLVLRPKRQAWAIDAPTDELRKVVRAAFQQRRKTLKNSMATLPHATEALAMAGIPATTRAEDVDVEGFLRLTAAWMTLRDAGRT